MTTPEEEDQHQKLLRESIRKETAAQTELGINDYIEQQKQDVLNNKESGLWGMIKAFIFKIADALGFGGFLAKLFGQPIPETGEVSSVSAQAGEAASKALTDTTFAFNNKDEFQRTLETQVRGSLTATDAINGASLDKIAHDVAVNTTERFSDLFDASGKRTFIPSVALSPADTLAAKQTNDALTAYVSDTKNVDKAEGLAKLAGIAGDHPKLSADQIKALSTVLGPKLAELKQNTASLEAQGSAVFDGVSVELQSTLKSGNQILKDNGMNFDDKGLALLGHNLAEPVVKNLAQGTQIVTTPPEQFVADGNNQAKFFAKNAARDAFADTLGKDENNDMRQGLAKLGGKTDLSRDDLLNIGGVMAPVLADLSTNDDTKKQLAADPAHTYAIVAQKLNEVLQTPEARARINQNDLNLSPQALQALAYGTAEQLVPTLNIAGVDKSPPANFVKAKEDARQIAIGEKIHSTVQKMSDGAIVDISVLSAVGGWREHYLVRKFRSEFPSGMGDKADTIDKYYDHKGDGYTSKDYTRNGVAESDELKQKKKEIYDYQVTQHLTLNDEQRTAVNGYIADALKEVVTSSANAELMKPENRAALGKAAQDRVWGKLIENREKLNSMGRDSGNTIDQIDSNLALGNGGLLAALAVGINDKITDPKDSSGYDQVKIAIGQVSESRQNIVKALATDKTQANAGGGSIPYSKPLIPDSGIRIG